MEVQQPVTMDMDFVHEQLRTSFAKITISDGSLDLASLEKKMMRYYDAKFQVIENSSSQYEFIDLFCGAGGLSIGLEQGGLRPVLAIDKDLSALLTYRFNRPWLSDKDVIPYAI